MMQNTAVSLIADTQDGCGEGPLWDARTHALCWVDILSDRLHRYGSSSGRVETRVAGVPASALALNETGELVIAGADGVWLRKEDGHVVPVAQSYEGAQLAINDCIADEHGRLLAGSAFFDGTDNYPRGSLYSIEPDGEVRILDSGFGLSNGMGFSADQSTL